MEHLIIYILLIVASILFIADAIITKIKYEKILDSADGIIENIIVKAADELSDYLVEALEASANTIKYDEISDKIVYLNVGDMTDNLRKRLKENAENLEEIFKD